LDNPGRPAKPGKVRLDLLIVERGLAESRTQAQAMLMAGRIRVPGVSKPKSGGLVARDQALELIEACPYVSRGGEKLQGALDQFRVDPNGRVCWDVGASTGGFTDCLLQRGARQVISIDVGHGQLHWKLRKDPRVVNLEKKHILQVEPGSLPLASLATVDVSFISLEKVLPHLTRLASVGMEFVALVKPQFEAGPKHAPKGVVRDPEVRAAVLKKLSDGLPGWGFRKEGEMVSPLKGPEGNVEFFLHFFKS
jgi:23S rRNA (cytidine1920-2'-O)/16S rRNA (cytidine1409-2'-O)-methyltransferase